MFYFLKITIFLVFDVYQLVVIQHNTHESTHHFTEALWQHLPANHSVWLHRQYTVPAGKHQQKEPG